MDWRDSGRKNDSGAVSKSAFYPQRTLRSERQCLSKLLGEPLCPLWLKVFVWSLNPGFREAKEAAEIVAGLGADFFWSEGFEGGQLAGYFDYVSRLVALSAMGNRGEEWGVGFDEDAV